MADRLFATMLAQVARLLPPADRDAVLGDLAEENKRAFGSIAAVLNLLAKRTWMTRTLPRLFASGSGAVLAQAVERSWTEWTVPLLVGLLVAACAVSVLTPGRAGTLTVPGLFVRSAALLGAAATAAIAGAFAAHRMYRDYFQRPSRWLIACAWSAAIWVPLVLLAWPQRSFWFVLTPIPIAMALSMSSKRQYIALQEAVAEERSAPQPNSLSVASVAPGRLQPFAIFSAFLLEATLLAGVGGHLSITASLVVMTTACLTWAFTPGTSRVQGSTALRSRYVVLPCFLLTCLALVPFLRAGLAQVLGNGVVLQPVFRSMPRIVAQNFRVNTTVVLLAPPQPHRKLVALPPKAVLGGVLRPLRPLHIPFDGSYWFALNDQSAKGSDIRVEHGDPATAHIHSSDWTPLQMEARQRLGTRLDAGCCSLLSVHLQNADNRPGLIEVEARLRDSHGATSREVSLGTLPIRSSGSTKISLSRAPIDETLGYRLESRTSKIHFNEIDLKFKLAHGRDLAGARVKIIGFTLQP